MPLCKVCGDLLQGRSIRLDLPFGHHRSITSLLEALEQGCYICGRYFQYLSNERQSILRKLSSSENLNSDAVYIQGFPLSSYVTILELKGEPKSTFPLNILIKINENPYLESLSIPTRSTLFGRIDHVYCMELYSSLGEIDRTLWNWSCLIGIVGISVVGHPFRASFVNNHSFG